MSPRTNFDFHLQTFPHSNISELYSFFDRLPTDPYISGKFRQRRFSHFIRDEQGFRKLDHTNFVQAKSVNYLAGGIKREFAELEDGLVDTKTFKEIIAAFVDYLDLDPSKTEIGAHQIRILCSHEFAGDPAPEGIHKDGFDFVGIFCIARDHVIGANTHLYYDKYGPAIFSRTLEPGEVVFTNDRRIFHYTDPVHPLGAANGHRDVFVLTA